MQAVSEGLGLEVVPWCLDRFDEFIIDGIVAVARKLDHRASRWALAHAIGHHQLHTGNELWARRRTHLATPYERQAEDYAWGLLVDLAEARWEGIRTPGEIAEYFGVPREIVDERMI